jgi:hypothetical protein
VKGIGVCRGEFVLRRKFRSKKKNTNNAMLLQTKNLYVIREAKALKHHR